MPRIGILTHELNAKLTEYAEAIESQDYDSAEIKREEIESMYLTMLRQAGVR